MVTRAKCLVLLVTRMRRSAKAWAAMRVSNCLMGVPWACGGDLCKVIGCGLVER